MSISSLALSRVSFVSTLLVLAATLIACGPAGMCDDVPAASTQHFVVSGTRAAELLAAADGGAGRPCLEECTAHPHTGTANGVSNCSVDAPTDGGVGLTCVYGGFACR